MVYTAESITKAEKYFVSSVRRDFAGARLYIYTFTSSIESFDLLNCYGDKQIQIEVRYGIL